MRRWVSIISMTLSIALVTIPVVLAVPGVNDLRAMSGEISALDAKAMTMSVKQDVAGSGIEEIRFVVDPAAAIRMHGLKGRNLGQLKVGDYVTVRYHVRDDKNIVLEIQHS